MLIVKETTDLAKYGFTKVDKKECEMYDDYTRRYFEWEYNMGHSRRGQFYYILVDTNRTLNIYATKPDGDGDSVLFSDVIKILIENNEIETNENR